MALFKILNNFASSNPITEVTTAHEGYCYFDKTTAKFWIDTSNNPTDRMALNAYKADWAVADQYAHPIHSTFIHTVEAGENNGELKIHKYNANGVDGFSTITIPGLGDLAFCDNVSSTYIPVGTNSTSNVTITPTTDTIYKLTSLGNVNTIGTSASLSIVPSATDSDTLEIIFTPNTPTAVTMPTGSQINVMTGVSSAVAAAQTFTGT